MHNAVLTRPNMSVEKSNFETLMERVRQGSQDAAWQLIEEYGSHICRVVKHSLDRSLQRRFDAVDVVQSVWKSFFRRPSQIRGFDCAEQLIAYLVAMARHKVVDTVRWSGAQKRDWRKEQSGKYPLERTAVAGDPSPSWVATAKEHWSQLLEEQPEHYREALRLRFMGKTYPEIATELRINERTARKIVKKLLDQYGSR